MKRWLAMLCAALLLTCPALAEETDPQTEANAAYARVLLEGAEALRLVDTYAAGTESDPQAEASTIALTETPVRFTVMDMDTYGLMEVVLEMPAYECYIILTYDEGRVYAAEIPYRGLLNLKGDGTHEYSSGAMDGGVRMLLMESAVLTTGVLADVRPTGENTVAYFIGGTQVDEAAYQAFLAEQEAKLPALWYDYTEENVKMLLGL